MSELLRVAAALGAAARTGESVELATVVRTEGSTYRRIGARLAITGDGRSVGAISGGCLESDVVARARAVHESGGSAIVAYDGRSPDDVIWGFGLGCNGLVEVLVEALAPAAAAAAAERLTRSAIARDRHVLATVIRAPATASIPVGAQGALWHPDAAIEGLEGAGDAARAAIQNSARSALEGGRPGAVRHDLPEGVLDVAYEIVVPTVRLAVCGAGVDAVPVVAAAKRLGWHVTLVDDRPAMASATRFPDADRIVVALPTGIGTAIRTVDCDAAIVMSHHFESDVQYLQGWLAAGVSYIGLLGPRSRAAQLIEATEARGVPVDPAARDRIHGPVGLDVGADTPEEIALAIVAEVQAARTGRSGGFLRERTASIHGP
jgi:xanthine dehydrogenase accessory factor